MKIPGFILALGFTTGILLESALGSPQRWILFPLLIVLPLLGQLRHKKVFTLLLFFSICLFGMLFGAADFRRPPNAVENWAARSVTVTDVTPGDSHSSRAYVSLEGVVASEPQSERRGKKLKVSLILAAKNLVRWNQRRREFYEVRGKVQVFLYQPQEIPEFGSRVRLKGTLEQPKPVMNPGEFNYGSYLANQKVFCILNGFGLGSVRILSNNEAGYGSRLLVRLRSLIRGRIERLFAGDPDAWILFQALILGDRKKMDAVLKDDFMKTGTSHLLAISGLNISLTVGSFCFLLLVLGLPQKLTALLGIMLTALQVAVSGFGIPVERAGIMWGLGFLAVLLDRGKHSLNIFFLAFFILLIGNSQWLFNIAFQLTFLSVFALIFILRIQDKPLGWLSELQGGVWVLLFTFPVVSYYFHVFSPISVLANFGAIPIFNGALVSALVTLFAGDVPFAGWLLIKFSGALIRLGLFWIHFLADKKWGYFFVPAPGWYQIVGYYLLFMTWLGLKGIERNRGELLLNRLAGWIAVRTHWLKPLVLSGWLLVFSSYFFPKSKPEFSLTLFSCGKNEIAHLQMANQAWLINAGRRLPSDQAQWMIAPYFKRLGFKRLTGVILTDFYARHTGGLPTIFRNFKVYFLIFPKPRKGEQKKFWLPQSKELNRIEVPAEELIRVNHRSRVLVRRLENGQMTLRITHGNDAILILPSLNEKGTRLSSGDAPRGEAVAAVVLSQIREEDSAALDLLIDQLAPEIIVLPEIDEGVKSQLQSRNVEGLDLSEYGAITFSKAAEGNNFHVQSMLKGEITNHG